ncbi:MAG: AAA family ATPase [Lachnospiraceae bacterium]|nr:AAA family ATPase [Lachnospiraceae bacterium]
MGIYLNPGNEVFRRIVSARIYVDKSGLLEVTNSMLDTDDNYICMSRPRRFGKTIAGNMIAAYYSRGCDSSGLFRNLRIASAPDYEKHLNKHNVIKIDLNSEFQNIKDKGALISSVQEKAKRELVKEYADISFEEKDSLGEALLKVYENTGDTFIILIDEYDVLVREQVPKELFDEYLSLLNGLFKSDTLRPAISLAYITGILPVVRDKVQSKLNNFREYTFLSAGRFAEYVGFTAEEVKELCQRYDVDYGECRNWYDGYTIGKYEIYNPESVVRCLDEGYFEGYWSKTSSYQVITERLKHNFKGIREDVVRMLAGEQVRVNVTSYMNTMDSFVTKDDVFTYLLHLGYLAYDREKGTCRIPNREVRQEWFNAMAADSDYEATDEIIRRSEEVLELTLKGDEEAVAKALDASHINVSSNRSYNNEDVLQRAIYLAYIYALNKYTVIKEMTTGKGFADVVYIPFKEEIPAMVIELKHNRCAESALMQIKEKKYFASLEHYSGALLLVGISYDEKTKEHECRIERWEK